MEWQYLFAGMVDLNVVSWTVINGAFAKHGCHGDEALEYLENVEWFTLNDI